jgi:hypothetical protein
VHRLAFALGAILFASCVGPFAATPSAPSATSSATPTSVATPPPSVSARPTVSAKELVGAGARTVTSPDGKWIASTTLGTPPFSFTLFDIEGKRVRSVEVPTTNWRWMPDSSGVFVALDVPQRPATLGVLDITGVAPRTTGLMMSGQTLSRDGKWIIASQAEGCCAFVTYPEIRMAPRAGGDPKTLVTSKSDPKGVALLGIDALDRVVYRDGGQIYRIALSAGQPQVVGTIADFKTTLPGNVSPDGTVVLVRGYEPQRWYVIANDRVVPWVDSVGTIVEDLQGERVLFGTAGLWIGPHALLVRAPSGELSSFDALAGSPTSTKASVRTDDNVLAYDRGRLLVGRASRALVIDLASGRESEVGVDFGASSDGARAWRAATLPGGGFILSTLTSTYRID